MRRAFTRDECARGGQSTRSARRALKEAGMAAAEAWRESGRCREPVADPWAPGGVRQCRALAWQPCPHRPQGLVR